MALRLAAIWAPRRSCGSAAAGYELDSRATGRCPIQSEVLRALLIANWHSLKPHKEAFPKYYAGPDHGAGARQHKSQTSTSRSAHKLTVITGLAVPANVTGV